VFQVGVAKAKEVLVVLFLNDFLHGFDEVFCLFFVRVEFVSGDGLDFSVGDFFLEGVELGHEFCSACGGVSVAHEFSLN